jgi:hypothetical protein
MGRLTAAAAAIRWGHGAHCDWSRPGLARDHERSGSHRGAIAVIVIGISAVPIGLTGIRSPAKSGDGGAG